MKHNNNINAIISDTTTNTTRWLTVNDSEWQWFELVGLDWIGLIGWLVGLLKK